MILIGHIVKEADGGAMVYVPYPAGQRKPEGCHESVGVEFVDKRRISAKQRKKAYVLIAYIGAWWGYTPVEAMKEMLKLMFVGEAETLRRTFSLSDCDMTTARLFITYLIDFCLFHGVDVGEPLYALAEDIPRYVWACLMNSGARSAAGTQTCITVMLWVWDVTARRSATSGCVRFPCAGSTIRRFTASGRRSF